MADKKVVFDVLARMREQGSDNLLKKTHLVAAAAGALAVKFGIDSVKAYADAQAKQAQLQDAYGKFPALANVSLKSLTDLNSAQELKTKFDDDETAAAESVLAQYKLTGTQLKQLVPLMQDYAARTGKDLPTAATDLGKAMLGQGKALKAIGINFKDTHTQGGNFEELMKGLRSQVGGFAEAEGKTASGRAAILKNEFGEFKESVGKAAVEFGQKLLPPLIQGANWLQQNWSRLQPFIVGLGGFVLAIYSVNRAMDAWSTVQKTLNAVMSANPVLRIITLIILLGTALVTAYKTSETFRDRVNGAFSAVQHAVENVQHAFDNFVHAAVNVVHAGDNVVHAGGNVVHAFDNVGHAGGNVVHAIGNVTNAFGQVGGGIGAAYRAVVDTFGRIVNFVAGMPGKISHAASGMWNGITAAFKGAINSIIGGWNSLQFSVPGFKVGPVHFGGFTLGVPDIPYLAKGGITSGPTLAVVGDNPGGREAIVPLPRNGGLGGGPIVLEFHSDGTPMADLLVQMFRKYIHANGGNVQVVLGQ